MQEYSNPSGLQSDSFVAIQVDLALAAAAGVQSLFPAANNVITLLGNRTYFFEGQFILNTGIVTHTTAMAFALAGGATVTSFEYLASIWSAAANTIATPSNTHVSGVASKVLNASSVNPFTLLQLRGVVRMNVGGTVDPQINFSANPTGTNLHKVGSYIRFREMGVGTIPAVGAWS